MDIYHVTYFYQATGMSGPDKADYGYIKASSAACAVDSIAMRAYPTNENDRAFLRGCLKAKKVKTKCGRSA